MIGEGNVAKSLLSGAGLVFLLGVLAVGTAVWGDAYVVESKAEWGTWSYPKGVMTIGDDGAATLLPIRKNINACLNAEDFEHTSTGGMVRGGIKDAGSNKAAARNIMDGDENTWWSPRQTDPLKDWRVEVDLGRVVSATKLRLVFAKGAQPFEEYTVYVSNGARIYGGSDIVQYTMVGKTTKPNTAYVVEYDLTQGGWEASDAVTSPTWMYAMDAQQVQYIRFVANAKSPNPGLAELELYTVGDNIALGIVDRGGSWEAGLLIGPKLGISDGDLTTYWQVKMLPDTDWQEEGIWCTWDLGATFWVDRIHVLSGPYRFATTHFDNYPQGYILRVSDGSKTPSGKINYQDLVDMDNNAAPYRFTFRHVFPLRRVRHIFFRHAHGTGTVGSRGQGGANIFEVQVYGEGYPAEAVMESGLIDLGQIAGDNRSKNITGLAWQGDTPPGTSIEIRTATGDSLKEEIHYFDQTGKEISEEKWKKTPKKYQGPKTVTLKPGGDWSLFSEVYRTPHGPFLSPSPQRYVRTQVALKTGNPYVTPSLRSIALYFSNPLVWKVQGEISPRSVEPDVDTTFTYLIQPTYRSGDQGFDAVMILAPAPVDPEQVALRIAGGEWTAAPDVRVEGDSLIVGLPVRVRRDSVAVRFVSRVNRNSTLVAGLIGDRQEQVWQHIDPVSRGYTTVMAPRLAESEDLIGNVRIDPIVMTPNGDGVHDRVDIRFSVLKVDQEADVDIYDLRGRWVRKLLRTADGGNRYSWDGRDKDGDMVLPGVYLCRIHVHAAAGRGTVNRTIYVTY